MNKTVNNCYNCPFYVHHYDEYAIGDGNTYECVLAYFLKYDNYHIDDNENSLLEPPDMCPIKKEGNILLKFKQLPMCNVLEISKYTEQIEQLDNELDNIDDFESDNYKSKYKLMTELCEKVEKLRNEE